MIVASDPEADVSNTEPSGNQPQAHRTNFAPETA